MIVDLLLGPYDKNNPQLPSLFPLPKRKNNYFLLFVNLLLSLRSESPTISIVLIQRRLKALRVFQCFTDQSGFGSPNETSLNYFVFNLLFQCDSQTISLMPPIIIILIIIITYINIITIIIISIIAIVLLLLLLLLSQLFTFLPKSNFRFKPSLQKQVAFFQVPPLKQSCMMNVT